MSEERAVAGYAEMPPIVQKRERNDVVSTETLGERMTYVGVKGAGVVVHRDVLGQREVLDDEGEVVRLDTYVQASSSVFIPGVCAVYHVTSPDEGYVTLSKEGAPGEVRFVEAAKEQS